LHKNTTNLNLIFIKMINFKNTEIAFGSKTDGQLRKAHFLFSMMNKAWLVRFGSNLGLWAMRMGLPINPIIRYTMFEQFCGGTNLNECLPTIEHLYKYNALTVLDYGAEAKTTEADYDRTMSEFLRAIDLAAQNKGKIPVVVCKFTGLASFETLEKLHAAEPLTEAEFADFTRAKTRLKTVCQAAFDKKVAIFIDAEESWIQRPIDAVVEEMMQQFNTARITVYNTYQLYLQSRLPYLRESFARAEKGGYLLGAKLVRGAYMEKERKRAETLGYPSPVQPDKAATDRDYNEAVAFCVENYTKISSCVASHNEKSTALQVELMAQKGIPNNHAHLNFCQLYGMSDHLTFNLGHAGYNSSKYVVYGEIHDVFPYLVRRAQENASITGDMSRELSFLTAEVERRRKG
jgi:proline dehydrogenase